MDDANTNGSFPRPPQERLTTIIARGDNWVVAHCLELGVVSQGRTEEEARQNLSVAVSRYLESFRRNELAG